MKTILTISFLLLVLFSCQNDDTKQNDQETKDSINQGSDKQSVKKEKDYLALGFDLMSKEFLGEIRIGMKMSDVTNYLGKPNKTSKSEIWGSDGEYHQILEYIDNGIELDMIGEDELSKTVNTISITQPCSLKTGKGIAIGSPYDDVVKAYKEFINPEFTDSNSIVAGSIYGGVVFNFDNKTVESIFIGAGAE